ncbi:response regulator transcription factor [Thiothrix lacustris]|uniref:response regulator transcription factor n=1 Tax=Thiothrix lacustris TaxID=525917 RepID=UPI0027E47244|nr:response regulator transcription factor [Thiothrix lacustris]WMP18996.1 response regulator transcription factor [Thiothrix lacustris]
MTTTNRILIADDHALMREAIVQRLLRDFPWAQSVCAASFEEVMACLQTQPPFLLVLLDLRMPGMSGVSSVAQVVAAAAAAPVIVCTAVEAPDLLFRLRQVGVRQVVSKAGHEDDLLTAIATLGLDAADIADEITPTPACNPAPLVTLLPVAGALLTARQQEILHLLHQGKPNKIIARELNVALGTVKNHLYVLFTRLQVNSRAEALAKTREWFL